MNASQTLEKPSKWQETKTVAFIRCGVRMRSCPDNLSPLLIEEAFEKGKKDKLRQLRVDLCEGSRKLHLRLPLKNRP